MGRTVELSDAQKKARRIYVMLLSLTLESLTAKAPPPTQIRALVRMLP